MGLHAWRPAKRAIGERDVHDITWTCFATKLEARERREKRAIRDGDVGAIDWFSDSWTRLQANGIIRAAYGAVRYPPKPASIEIDAIRERVINPSIIHVDHLAIDEGNGIIRSIHDLDITHGHARALLHRDGFRSQTMNSISIDDSPA